MKGKKLGEIGEDIACAYLEAQGYKIIERNIQLKLGEIDIVAENDNCLVFVEVKTKSNKKYGLPQEMVGFRKQQKLINLAQLYLKKNNFDNNQNWRIDVVSIIKDDNGNQYIELIKNAIQY